MDKVYIAIDGDDVGRQIEYYILTNDQDALYLFSARYHQSMEWLSKKLQSDLGAEVIFFGGDSLLASAMANERLVTVLENIRQEFHSYSGYTLSVGIASSLQISYLALKLAKASGKNRLQYSR